MKPDDEIIPRIGRRRLLKSSAAAALVATIKVAFPGGGFDPENPAAYLKSLAIKRADIG